MRLQVLIGDQLRKRKELLYNLGALSSYASMLTFFWHGVVMLMSKEKPKHTLVVYAALTLFPFWSWLLINGTKSGCALKLQ